MARSRTVKRVLATRRRQKSVGEVARESGRKAGDGIRVGQDDARSRKPTIPVAKRAEAERANSAKSSTSDAMRRDARREIDASPVRPNANATVKAPRRARASALEVGDDNTEAAVPEALPRQGRAPGRGAGERNTRRRRRDAAG